MVRAGMGVADALAYLLYRDAWSAVVIDTVFGGVSMITELAFLDLAAKSCPRRVEARRPSLLCSGVARLAEFSHPVVEAGAYDAPAGTVTTRLGLNDIILLEY